MLAGFNATLGAALSCGLLFWACGTAGAQATGGPGATTSAGSGLSTTQVNQAQQQLNSGSVSGSSASSSGQNGGVSSDSFKGSIVSGTATPGVMDLSLDEAIQRGTAD